VNAKLEDVYSQIPKSSCPDNCGKCCGPIMPSLAEIREIKGWCRIKHIEYREFLNTNDLGNCPYLTAEKKCLIYPVRPFLCRLLGVSIDIPCPIGKCEAKKALNHPQSDALYKAIYLHGKEKSRTEKHQKIVREVLSRLGYGTRI